MKTMKATRVAAAAGVVAVTFAVLVLSPRLLLAAGPSSAPATQGASVALPSDAAGPSSAPATQGASEALPSDVQAELSSLPVGYVIVPCTAAHPVMPGVRTSHTSGWAARHPSFRYLSHGYCAENPNATPMPVVAPLSNGDGCSLIRLAPAAKHWPDRLASTL
jgi:hypothetical protein